MELILLLVWLEHRDAEVDRGGGRFKQQLLVFRSHSVSLHEGETQAVRIPLAFRQSHCSYYPVLRQKD